jgi:rubrerythrin
VGRPRAERRALRAANEARCERILDTAAPLAVDDLDWASVGTVDVGMSVLDTLVYMRDVEGFTDRDPVGLVAHRTTLSDPLLRRFLELWRSEERVHSAVLERWLDAYAAARSLGLPPRQLPPPAVAPLRERAIAQIGGPVGHVVAAAHMAWGAANELLTLNGYRILAERSDDPVLSELLQRIAAQESRHYSFYLLQAEWRLAASPLARWALPKVLDGTWTPVGIGDGYKTREEFERVLAYLASGRDGRSAIARMDNRFSRLPGFERLRIFRDATAAVLDRSTAFEPASA